MKEVIVHFVTDLSWGILALLWIVVCSPMLLLCAIADLGSWTRKW